MLLECNVCGIIYKLGVRILQLLKFKLNLWEILFYMKKYYQTVSISLVNVLPENMLEMSDPVPPIGGESEGGEGLVKEMDDFEDLFNSYDGWFND